MNAIKRMVISDNFFDLCSHWKNRVVPEGVLYDVFDGVVWKTFTDSSDELFFFSNHGLNLGLLLNVDWYQPFKHSIYSVGVIFIAILNLPRHLRFRPENFILCGIIPGPSEPELTINQYLEPLVDELLQLWRGVSMNIADGSKMTVKAVLVCVSCDTPAARKVGGYLGHSAQKGYFKCLKSFDTPEFGMKANYSGFERDLWEPRNNDHHRKLAMKHKHALTRKGQSSIEKSDGIRYSELARLPYFKFIDFFVVDPMHNLLLGTSKHSLDIWKTRNVLNAEALMEIQSCVDKFVVPSDIGCIPSKIASGFCGFTADQWKHWIIVFSLVCMKPFLTFDEYKCWQNYVYSVSVFSSSTVSEVKIKLADKCIHEFCVQFSSLYGEEACTPNTHLHCHMSDSLLNHGPSPSFWLFSFKRINGILGKFQTNSHSIEVQFMRKFLTSQQINQHFYVDYQ